MTGRTDGHGDGQGVSATHYRAAAVECRISVWLLTPSLLLPAAHTFDGDKTASPAIPLMSPPLPGLGVRTCFPVMPFQRRIRVSEPGMGALLR